MRFVRPVAAIAVVVVLTAVFVQPACGCASIEKIGYASMKGELRGASMAQEEFIQDSARYARSMDELLARGYQPHPDIKLVITPATEKSWTIIATHSRVPEARCEVSNVSNLSTIAPIDGEPQCDPPYKSRLFKLRKLW